ncbi:unnamed protein product [Lactuca saligna]|uniref:non-specific serine/threonine protein kinase n=1 Tax=Lactuca saligna TaxID=75948 RepID=A0AA36EJZ2_LACSI|nr:unnamed protein product [Lactuca saligna]
MSDLLLPLSLYLFLSLLFFISIDAQSSNSVYPNCPSYNCGNINISYPFWRIGSETSTQFCGYPGFGINCSNNGDQRDIPIINLEYESYYIQNITYGTRSIILQDYDVFTAVHCPRMNHNITIKSLPFIFSDQNVNLSIHFNCNGVPHFAHEIPCLSSRTNKSCVNSVHSEPADFNWDAYSCDDNVIVTTVLDVFRSINELGIEFIRALRGGFELRWWEIEDCEMCENSDGRCGYNNDTREFMCFCSGGTTKTGQCKNGTCKLNPTFNPVLGIITKFGKIRILNRKVFGFAKSESQTKGAIGCEKISSFSKKIKEKLKF